MGVRVNKLNIFLLVTLGLILGLFYAAVPQAQAAESYSFFTQWGTRGYNNGQFRHPGGIAVDNFGNVYVVDHDNHRIQKFNAAGSFITAWGGRGSGDGQFKWPQDVAVDRSGYVYVTDGGGGDNCRVQKFNSSGAFITKWGSCGSGNGQFWYPEGIAVDAAGRVYVADGYDRIQKFNSSGGFIAKWENSYLKAVSGVAVDKAGNVYAVSHNDFRIRKFNPTGSLLATIGGFGSGNGEFNDPRDVEVDSAGNIYVVDHLGHNIEKFNASGNFITKIENRGSAVGQFEYPSGVAVDSSFNVYFTADHRVQKYRIAGFMRINSGALYSRWTTVRLNSAVSGATQMRFQNAGGLWSPWQAYSPVRVWALPKANGTKTVYANYRFASGNIIARGDTIVLDAVPPTGFMQLSGGAIATRSRIININSHVRGAATMRFRNAGGAWGAWTAYMPSRGWILPPGYGTKVVYAQYRDAAGNVMPRSDSIILRR